MGQPVTVEARALAKRFGQKVAVIGIDLAVLRGEIFGLLGSNGAGKTTTLRMLSGLTVPSSGGGHALAVRKKKIRRRKICREPGNRR